MIVRPPTTCSQRWKYLSWREQGLHRAHAERGASTAAPLALQNPTLRLLLLLTSWSRFSLQLRRFLLDAPRPTSADRTAATAPPNGASGLPPASQGSAAAAAAATANSRRRTAPTVLSKVHEPLSPISARRAGGPGLGTAFPDDDSVDGAAGKAAGGGGGGGTEAREIPSLRPEIQVGSCCVLGEWTPGRSRGTFAVC